MNNSPLTECYICSEPGTSHRSLEHKRIANLWQCPGCGLAYQNPQPSDKQLQAIYNRDYFARWADSAESRAHLREIKRATFRIHLARIEKYRLPGRLLDIGCGAGHLVELARERGWEAQGLDLNPGALDLAPETARAHIHIGDLATADYPSGYFDAITMSHLLEHHRDPKALLGKVSKLLIAGGIVLIEVPDISTIWFRILGWRWPHFHADHLWHFSGKAISMLTEQRGYAQLTLQSVWKPLSLQYMDYVSADARSFWLRSVVTAIERILPAKLNRTLFRLPCSELLYLGRKDSG